MTNKEHSAPVLAMADNNVSAGTAPPFEAGELRVVFLQEPDMPKMPVPRKPRTKEDFYRFCTTVLKYAQYDSDDSEPESTRQEARTTSNPSPPLDSSGSSVNSESTNSGHEGKASGAESSDNEDSFDLVTCYCNKPFAGRPMIECSSCLTWVHLSCAKIKKTNIPDVFHCAMCKSSSNKKQRSVSPPNPPDKGVKRLKRTT